MDLRRLVPFGLLALALAAGCGEQQAPTANQRNRPATASADPALPLPTAVPAPRGEVATRYPVTVLEDGGHGPQACLGGEADSLPPRCGGPDLVGWSWVDHAGDFEQRSGTRWGEFLLQGTFDGTSITPTKVVAAADAPAPGPGDDPDEPDLTTPCPPPDGGWRVLDPSKTTQASLDATRRAATRLDGYADEWVDQSINPAWAESESASPPGEDLEEKLNDPTLTVIDVRVTHDAAGAQAELRTMWGGSLCVSTAPNTDAVLARAQDQLDNHVPGFMGSGRSSDQVQLAVTYDDGSLQRLLDRKYGASSGRHAIWSYSRLRGV